MITAISCRSIITLEDCITFAKKTLSDREKVVLGLVLKGIKEVGDYICCNPFVAEDEDGEPILDDAEETEELAIPAGVETWILRKFSKIIEYRLAGNNTISIADLGTIQPDPEDWKELLPWTRF